MPVIWCYFFKVLILVQKYNPEYKFKSPPFLPVLLKLRARVICNSSQVSRQNHRLLETLKFSSEPNSRLRQYHVQAGLGYLGGFRLASRHQQNSTAHRMPLQRRFIKVLLAKRMSAREQDAVNRLPPHFIPELPRSSWSLCLCCVRAPCG